MRHNRQQEFLKLLHFMQVSTTQLCECPPEATVGIKADQHYYLWIDRFSSSGLGNNAVILDGQNSDSLIAFQQDIKTWVRLTSPYPMGGLFSRFLDARIDDPKGGWKGRGIYAANHSRGTLLTEGMNGKSPSQLFHIQVRPDPLAK
jgi:hypothetical protein